MHRFVRAATAALVLGTAVRAEAQLPTVQQVYDRFAEAVGGVAAWKPVTGRTETGTANITFAGISGSYERFSALPNKNRLILDLGVVRIDQGYDGEKGWVDQGQGPQPMPPEMMKSMSEVSPDALPQPGAPRVGHGDGQGDLRGGRGLQGGDHLQVR
jgi:hypothetical protein